MNSRKSYLVIASAVLALSTAVRAGADTSATDAQTQAGVLLTARSPFHSPQPPRHAGAAPDAQSQARAIVTVERDNGAPPLPGHATTQLAHRGVDKNADAQSMAATVLLGRGA